MTTPTANYSWPKPVNNADSDTWGTELNTIFDDIDAALGSGASGAALNPLSIKLGSGTALTSYVEGTWTPVDSSGGGLTFTVAKATYVRIGRVLHYVLKLTFPATADANGVAIGGLPVAAAALSSGLSPYISDSGSAASFPIADVIAGTTTIQLLNLAGSSGMTNANMSGKYLVICGTYFVS